MKSTDGTGFMELRGLEQRARELGAAAARVVPADQVVVDERVRLKCQVPLCPEYGHNLMCPPALPSVSQFQRMVQAYRWGLLVQVRAPLEETPPEGREEAGYRGARQLHRLVQELEREAMSRGLSLAAGFIGGTCRLCARCVGQGSGEACRHPFEARPSMEAMGIDVQATCRRAGLNPGGFPVSEEVIWTGMVLLD